MPRGRKPGFYFSDEAKMKVQLFRETYPDTPLVVATNDVIKMMEV